MADAPRPTPSSPGFLYAAMRVFDLSIGEMLWSRRTIFMGLVVGLPVFIAFVLRALFEFGASPISVNNSAVSGPVIFGLMMWFFFVRFAIPVLGVFYGTSLIADEVEDKTITYLFSRPIPRAAVLVGKYVAYLACTVCVVLPGIVLVWLLVAPINGSLGATFPDLLADLALVLLGLTVYGALFALFGTALKRPLLEQRAKRAFSDPARRAEIEAFLAERPRVDDYARFRAAMEAQRRPWTEWPETMRDGALCDGDFDQTLRQFHQFAQFTMHDQLMHFANDADCAGLYLDLPVGASATSYDVWRDRAAFVSGATIGAPPDELFSGGQNWGLPPVHPQRQRARHYRYFIDSVRAHVEHADMLRVDHVMGLHRLYWIPDGAEADEGMYVHYPASETYAILALESVRHQCGIAGEDLGTVPDDVRPAMTARGISRLYLSQFAPDEDPPADSVASLGTHDTPTFAAYLTSRDPAAEPPQAMRREVLRIAGSDARVALVTLEDIWLETKRQNVPGPCHSDHPNWRRKLALTLDEVMELDREPAQLLRAVNERRKCAIGVAGDLLR